MEQKTDLQADDLFQLVERRGWQLYRTYEDKVTGTSSATQRLELNQLMQDARSRKFDVVVIWKLDRLFRSLKDLVITLEEFSDLGIELVSVKDNIDLTTAAGRLLMQIIGAMAEFEHSLIRARCKAGLEAAKRRGVKLGRPRQVDGERVVALRERGLSLKAIAKEMGISKSAVHKTLAGLSPQSRP